MSKFFFFYEVSFFKDRGVVGKKKTPKEPGFISFIIIQAVFAPFFLPMFP
jgi:hypothetical protein